jgi:hypothetical protein
MSEEEVLNMRSRESTIPVTGPVSLGAAHEERALFLRI